MRRKFQRKNSRFHVNKMCAGRILKTEGAKEAYDFMRAKMLIKRKDGNVSEKDHVVR
jgi:hypothetical protein